MDGIKCKYNNVVDYLLCQNCTKNFFCKNDPITPIYPINHSPNNLPES